MACQAGAIVPAPARHHCLGVPGLALFLAGRRLRPVWGAGYADGRLARWSKIQALPGSFASVAAPQIGGPAGRFTVGPSDVPTHGGNRAEVVAPASAVGGYPNRIDWYAWSTYFPGALDPVPDQTWNIFTQWHQSSSDECHPNVAFAVDTALAPARLRLTVRGGWVNSHTCVHQSDRAWNLAPLIHDHWYDLAFGVKWSSDPRVGWIELAIDGRRVIPRTLTATLYRDQDVYLKQGLYRAPFAGVSRLYEGGMTRFAAPAGP
jgi:hypothetical protein